jgi:uncharacterized protein (DUF608 family)
MKSSTASTHSSGLLRRNFLKLSGLTVAGMAFSRSPAVAGPFDATDFQYSLIPSDKKLSREWLASLVARGEPEVHAGSELNYIGMPVGGFCTGQIYLGGDGRLWHWDVFNAELLGKAHYADPLLASSPIEQGFAIKANGQARALDRSGFPGVTFLGQYPIGTVTYRDNAYPLEVTLEAWSPFIPLNAEDSGLPATVMEFTVRNRTDAAVEAELGGWLENAVGRFSPGSAGLRKNRILREGETLMVASSARNNDAPGGLRREDILFEDFEGPDYAGWTREGDAFGSGPARLETIPAHQAPAAMNVHGKGTANSHASAPGTTSEERDKATGRLVSKPFRIGRNHIKFLIGGGNAPDRLGMRLLIDGAAVRSATGHDATAMREEIWDVREFVGRDAVLEISDQHNGGWGHIGVDRIVFTDDDGGTRPVEGAPDFGTMALAVLGEANGRAVAEIAGAAGAESLFQSISSAKDPNETEKPLGVRISGGLAVPFRLEPGAERKITFVIAWHFPRVQYSAVRMPGWDTIQDLAKLKRYYARRFADAPAVADHIARNFQRLSADTHLWRDTWYDSTLPHWLLDRTLLNISTLATATCHRFDNGRYWFWEGLYCCQGTCTHVWAYAQAIGRLFPEIERDLRERVDYGIGFVENTGAILQRAETEASTLIAVDGHAGTILRTLREHQMSPDDTFLQRVWPKVKKAVEWLVAQDGDEDGVISGAQLHTLDQPWYGHIPWISSLYSAALRAAALMAREMNDDASATRWEKIAAKASQRISEDLWHKKQFFIQKAPPDKLNELGAGYGCEIDQVLGQSWAFQVGLPRVLPEEQTRKALESLWKYNFTPDVGPFRAASPIPGGRWYAMPGEGGLVM